MTIEYKATDLAPGDEFTIDEGETWRTVQLGEPIRVVSDGEDEIVLGRDSDGQRFWLWASETVVVR
jgi:hypothetical protein